MTGAFLILSALLFLPKGESVRTDCFLGVAGDVPSNVAAAEVLRGEDALTVRIWRRHPQGVQPRASGRAYPPASMFDGGGESVEVALAPHPENSSVYYHFIVNPSNELYQARCQDGSWRPSVPVSSQPFFEPTRWGVVLTLPYAAFGVSSPADGVRWRANFASVNVNWAGVSNYHAPDQFGTLVFGGEPPEAVVESASLAPDGTIRVTYEIPPRLKPGEVPHKAEDVQFDFTLTEGNRPLASFPTQTPGEDPAYFATDRFFYPAGEPFDMVYSAKKFGRCALSIRRLTDDTVVAAVTNRSAAGTLALEPLGPGDYALEVSDGRSWTSCQFGVIDFAAEPPAGPRYAVVGSQKIVSSNVVFKKVFPARFTRTPATGMIYDPSKSICGAEEVVASDAGGPAALYRLAYEAQMAVMMKGKEGNVSFIEDRSGFYRRAYGELKRRFPERRFSIHVDHPDRAAEFAQACDVFEYAVPRCSYVRDLLGGLREGVVDAKRLAQGRPVMLWLGASLPENGSRRSVEELNAAIRYSVLKGLVGNVFHLGHGCIPESNTRLWSFLRDAERAVNAWYPVWASGEDLSVEATAEEDVVYGFRRTARGVMLLAVNFSRRARTLTFSEPTTGRRRTIRLPGCGSLASLVFPYKLTDRSCSMRRRVSRHPLFLV